MSAPSAVPQLTVTNLPTSQYLLDAQLVWPHTTKSLLVLRLVFNPNRKDIFEKIFKKGYIKLSPSDDHIVYPKNNNNIEGFDFECFRRHDRNTKGVTVPTADQIHEEIKTTQLTFLQQFRLSYEKLQTNASLKQFVNPVGIKVTRNGVDVPASIVIQDDLIHPEILILHDGTPGSVYDMRIQWNFHPTWELHIINAYSNSLCCPLQRCDTTLSCDSYEGDFTGLSFEEGRIKRVAMKPESIESKGSIWIAVTRTLAEIYDGRN